VLKEADEIEQSDEYEVKEVMGSTLVHGKILYLVKWEGYPNKKDWTREPYEHFLTEGAKDQIRRFHESNPDAPKDPRVILQPSAGSKQTQGRKRKRA
jgi:hypothetical protein